ncbi:hypothetical protein LCGC14_1318480 [marine sediment metagenome]|uniref:Uncharacterized protein n=1 Tax=marine sediment metagenome TaxID=412755 RepID=A0A0F9KK73_9ZZZZ
MAATNLVYRDLGYYFPVYQTGGQRIRNSFVQYWKWIHFNQNITDGNSAATEDVRGMLVAPHRMYAVRAVVVPTEGTVALNVNDYARVRIFNMGRSGGAIIHTIADGNTSAIAWTLDVENVLALTTGGVNFISLVIERGEFIKVQLDKEGSGVACENLKVSLMCKAIEGHV